MRELNVGSDFSGIGAFAQALNLLGLPYTKIFACDMDKFARKSYVLNYGTPEDLKLLKHPDVVFCDDIYNRYANRKLKRPSISEYKKLLTIQERTARLFSFYYPWNVKYRKGEDVDIYMTSPPCQAFSFAGNRKGEADKRGVLFYNSHSFIKENKPRYFLFENVKGLLSDNKGETFKKWLDFLGGISVNGEPVESPHPDSVPYNVYFKVLNAKHYGVPQNRERVFIVGIRSDQDNNFNWPKPFPLEKRLKDILETFENSNFKTQDEFDAYLKKYFLSDNAIEKLLKNNEDISHLSVDKIANTLRVGGGGSTSKKNIHMIL